jgi:hypothetical protein
LSRLADAGKSTVRRRAATGTARCTVFRPAAAYAYHGITLRPSEGQTARQALGLLARDMPNFHGFVNTLARFIKFFGGMTPAFTNIPLFSRNPISSFSARH